MKSRVRKKIVSCCLALGVAFSGALVTAPVMAAVEDSTPPRITGLSGTTSEGEAYGMITSSEAGNFYYLALPQDTKAEVTIAYIRKAIEKKQEVTGSGTVNGIEPTTFPIDGLQPRTTYVLYAFMTDLAGNDSEKPVVSVPFNSSSMILEGNIKMNGDMTVGSQIKADTEFISAEPRWVYYQWYRIALKEDQEKLNEVIDETGGAAEDVLVPFIDEDILSLDGSVVESGRKRAVAFLANQTSYKKASYDAVSLEDATLISGATKSSYRITKEDVGCRLVIKVTSSNYRGELMGYTDTCVPKLMPEYARPSIDGFPYSATRTLSSFPLPSGWSWVDPNIVPVVESGGYRAKYTPEESDVYSSVILRLDVPIERKSLTASMVDVFDTVYEGQRIQDNFEVSDGGRILKRGQDYVVSYQNSLNVGVGTVIFEGVGNYKSTVRKSYRINKCPVAKLTFTYDKKKEYTGQAITGNLMVENGTRLLKKNQDYAVTYHNNKNIGTASAVIQGLGNYQGTKKIKFQIVPQTADVSVQSQKGSHVSLKFGSVPGISGYRLYFAKDKKFTQGVQKFLTTKSSMVLRGMARGSYYYLRLKTYKVVNGKKVFSNFGKTTTIWVY